MWSSVNDYKTNCMAKLIRMLLKQPSPESLQAAFSEWHGQHRQLSRGKERSRDGEGKRWRGWGREREEERV